MTTVPCRERLGRRRGEPSGPLGSGCCAGHLQCSQAEISLTETVDNVKLLVPRFDVCYRNLIQICNNVSRVESHKKEYFLMYCVKKIKLVGTTC